MKVYNGRKALAHALNDTKTAVKQLDKLVTAILIIIVLLVWLLLMEIATTKVLVFLSSQVVVAAFMFGNTCKTIFEAIIFVFVMHPFDVGDRVVVDGVQVIYFHHTRPTYICICLILYFADDCGGDEYLNNSLFAI